MDEEYRQAEMRKCSFQFEDEGWEEQQHLTCQTAETESWLEMYDGKGTGNIVAESGTEKGQQPVLNSDIQILHPTNVHREGKRPACTLT